MSRGAGAPQVYPTLSIIHTSRPVSTTGRLPSGRNKVFLQFTF